MHRGANAPIVSAAQRVFVSFSDGPTAAPVDVLCRNAVAGWGDCEIPTPNYLFQGPLTSSVSGGNFVGTISRTKLLPTELFNVSRLSLRFFVRSVRPTVHMLPFNVPQAHIAMQAGITYLRNGHRNPKIVMNQSKTRDIVLTEANTGNPLKGDFERMARRRFQDPTPKRRGAWWTIQVRQDVFVDGKVKRKNKRVRLAPASMPERQVRKIVAEYLRPLNQELQGPGSATNFCSLHSTHV